MTVAEEANTLMTRDEAAEYLGIRPQTLAAWACRQEGPTFIKCGRSVRYRQRDIEIWLDRRTLPAPTQ